MDIDLARAWVRAIAAAVDEQKDQLTRLDSAIGDADHGTNMHRGFTAASTAVEAFAPETVGAVLVKAGTTLISNVGGASGPLYGSAFRAIGQALDSPTATPEQVAEALA
ncbi:DAK2 domain-containing protein, partial [Kitasatospora sp. SUK 42]|uniref:DAK2 domain-containing protein n=1 Tax=Kitasatospora sp. SUK 42 TaxID=1588882 RepID=UPI0027E2FB61